MLHTTVIRLLMLSLAIVLTACVRADRVTTAATVNGTQPGVVEESQSASATVQTFTTINGADLPARLDEAARQGNKQTRYWSAYSFDVRPGVAVDPSIHEFHGSMNTIGDTTIFIGTTASGMTVETRNLGIFLLREAGNNQITRVEIYNLERKREYSGYPVYWLGRANNQESLDYLQGMAAAAPMGLLSERAVLAIALHDDGRVGSLLKNFVRTSQNQRVRASAVRWLGQVGGEQAFLADLVRNDSEDRKLRRQAAHAIGEGRDPGSLALLQSLYASVKDNEIHRSIVQAVGDNDQKDEAFAFMVKVARTDPDVKRERLRCTRSASLSASAVEELSRSMPAKRILTLSAPFCMLCQREQECKGTGALIKLARSEPDLNCGAGRSRAV